MAGFKFLKIGPGRRRGARDHLCCSKGLLRDECIAPFHGVETKARATAYWFNRANDDDFGLAWFGASLLVLRSSPSSHFSSWTTRVVPTSSYQKLMGDVIRVILSE
jgi:hypothetical protein